MIEHDDAALNSAVGRAVRARRVNLGVTQQQLADALGVAKSALSRYESGERRWTVALLLRAAGALHQPVSAMLPNQDLAVATSANASPVSADGIDRIALVLRAQPHLVPTVASLLETLLEAEPDADIAADT